MQLIIDNLRRTAPLKKVWLRLPLIPGFNDGKENLRRLAELAKELKVERLSLLPFNQHGQEKSRAIGASFAYPDITPPSDDSLNEIKVFLEELGVKVTLGL